MCLMCEYYLESCSEPECVEAARLRAKDVLDNERKNSRGNYDGTAVEEYWGGRSNYKLFLWKGYTQPCEHIIARHGPECNVVKRHDDPYGYGLLYDVCNCYGDGNGNWDYD